MAERQSTRRNATPAKDADATQPKGADAPEAKGADAPEAAPAQEPETTSDPDQEAGEAVEVVAPAATPQVDYTKTDANGAPVDPNAPGAVAVANDHLPVEPGTETRVGIDGVANPAIINKEGADAVPGAPLDTDTTSLAPTTRVQSIEQTLATPGSMGGATVGTGERVLDEATGEAPDVDSMFEHVVGGTYRSTVRLVETVPVGNGSTTTRLVMPAGQVVSAATVEKFKAVVKAQG